MAHGNCESMRSRAFTKGRSAFDSDEEYRLALRGELDDEGPDTEGPWEDEGDNGDPADEEAVKAELEDLEDRIGGTHFLEVLERFMKDCSGREEPPYLPFPLTRDREALAVFCSGSETLRLRYGAYGLEADRLEGDEVVKTWKGLSAVQTLNDWDDALYELAEEAEVEKKDLEDGLKDEFFDDTLPGILADRRRGAAFLDFVTGAPMASGDPAVTEWWLPLSERLWLGWDRAASEFRLKRPGEDGSLATWEEEEFLDKLGDVAWDDSDARNFLLGGEDVRDAWEALDGAWYDEESNGAVVDGLGKFLDRVSAKDTKVPVQTKVTKVTVCGETGRWLKFAWNDLAPEMAQLTVVDNDDEADAFDVPLAFLRWWAFCRDMNW